MYIHRNKILRILVCLMILSLLVVSTAAAGTKKPVAKNIIVMIADGRGFRHLEATSYYQYGRAAGQVYNRFPFKFAMSTYEAYYADNPCYGQGYDPALA